MTTPLSRLCGFLALLIVPALVMASNVDPAPESRSWVGIVIAVVLVGGVIVANIKSARRSHQD